MSMAQNLFVAGDSLLVTLAKLIIMRRMVTRRAILKRYGLTIRRTIN